MNILVFLEKLTSQRQVVKKPEIKTLKKRPINSPGVSADMKIKKQKLQEQQAIGQVEEEKQEEGHFELNDLMTHIIEDELQAIMIKVWQALPDNPPSEAERFVAERLRNEASDDIRNVLGLNVTKRLLNVFNPLYIKAHFSCRPENSAIRDFVDAFSITCFKRTKMDENMYLGRMSNISDFDRICAAKNIRCGNAMVNVIPTYRFSQCPQKLNTVFVRKFKGTEKQKNVENATGSNTDVEKAVTEKMNTETASNEKKEIQATNSEKGMETETRLNQTETKITQVNIEKIPEDKKIIVKTENNKAIVAKKQESNQSNKVEQSLKQTIKVEQSVKQTNKVEQSIKVTTVKENNVTPNKVTDTNKPKVDKIIEKKTEKVGNVNATLKPKPKPNQVNQEVVATKKLNEPTRKLNVKNVEKINSEKFDETDEMNDEEILALISTGVVVDECSGSDEE